MAQYLLKGSQVFVDGSPDVKMYKNNQGEVKANIILRVHNIQLLGGTKAGEVNQQPQSNQPIQQENNSNGYQPVATDYPLTGDDDLPF